MSPQDVDSVHRWIILSKNNSSFRYYFWQTPLLLFPVWPHSDANPWRSSSSISVHQAVESTDKTPPSNTASSHDPRKHVVWRAPAVYWILTQGGLVDRVSPNILLINQCQSDGFDFFPPPGTTASSGANVSLAKMTTASMADRLRYF